MIPYVKLGKAVRFRVGDVEVTIERIKFAHREALEEMSKCDT
jgi:hypothetical protein